MNSVDMKGDTASVSLENLSLELCKFAKRVPKHSSFEIASLNVIQVRQTVNGVAKKCSHKHRCFWKILLRRIHGLEPTSDPHFYQMASVAESKANLVSALSPRLPDVYVNQKDKFPLPHPIIYDVTPPSK